MLPISSGNKKKSKFKYQISKFSGVGVIELLIVVAILAVTLTAILGMANFSFSIQILARQTIQADSLAREGMEQIRNARDNAGWNQMAPESITTGIFTRTITITDSQRDASDNIVESGGIPDPDTKKITVAVSWSERNRPHEVKLVTYLTNWRQ